MVKRLILLGAFMAVSFFATAERTLDSLFTVLDKEVAQADIYITRRQAMIDSLRAVRPMTDAVRLQIAEEYQHFQSDSSRAGYLKLQNAEPAIRKEACIRMVRLLASSVWEKEDPETFKSSEGYKSAWLLYSDVASNAQIPIMQEEAKAKTQQYYDSMMVELEHEAAYSEESALWLASYRAQDRHDWNEAIYYNEQLMNRYSPNDNQYAILAYGQAMLYEQMGNQEKRMEWLVRSAICDVRCGITDNGSSWVIAQDCFEAGDIRRAYKLSDYSLTNATFFNAPTRFIQNFTPGHLIALRYEHEHRQATIRLSIALGLFGLALIAAIIIAVHSRRQNRKLHLLNAQLSAINAQLKEADKVKEQYICRYLEVYSDYIRRLTTMARKAGEKDSAAFMDREMENFYRSFDDTFLSLYGSFVQDFNALLKPELRITPKPGERMTVELRIFALILLGITSSAKIADLLCYSPNTISNYRVKMKNGALGDRDTFEQRVQQIRNSFNV